MHISQENNSGWFPDQPKSVSQQQKHIQRGLLFYYFNYIDIVLMVKSFGGLNQNGSSCISSFPSSTHSIRIRIGHSGAGGEPWERWDSDSSSLGLQWFGIPRYQLY